MAVKHFILTTARWMTGRWKLSLIRIFSLSSGIVTFLLVRFYYLESPKLGETRFLNFLNGSPESAVLLGFILSLTSLMYFLLVKSQLALRQKELFWRKFYGESFRGTVLVLIAENTLYILISFLLSMVLFDLLSPYFNLLTGKEISLRNQWSMADYLLMLLFLSILVVTIGLLPSLWYARSKAPDILKKLL